MKYENTKDWINVKGFCFLQKTDLFTYFLFKGVEYKVFNDVLNWHIYNSGKSGKLFLDDCEQIHI